MKRPCDGDGTWAFPELVDARNISRVDFSARDMLGVAHFVGTPWASAPLRPGRRRRHRTVVFMIGRGVLGTRRRLDSRRHLRGDGDRRGLARLSTRGISDPLRLSARQSGTHTFSTAGDCPRRHAPVLLFRKMRRPSLRLVGLVSMDGARRVVVVLLAARGLQSRHGRRRHPSRLTGTWRRSCLRGICSPCHRPGEVNSVLGVVLRGGGAARRGDGR